MNRLFAVRYDNHEGPDSLMLVEAETSRDALHKVQESFKKLDLTVPSENEFELCNIGYTADELFSVREDNSMLDLREPL